YLLCQFLVIVYMLLVSLDWLYVDVFRIEGETSIDVLRSLLMQKVPDLVIIGLLFIPFHSQRFFRQSK
ncbi:YbjO family protein, partial [Vibrio toranzoniae]